MTRARLIGTIAASLAVGAGSTAGVVASTGGREHLSITIPLGDSIKPAFSFKVDTVMILRPGSFLKGRRCGLGQMYLRVLKDGVVKVADTVDITVACDSAPPVPTSVSVCYAPTDSIVKYGIDASKSLNAAQDSLVQKWCKKSDTLTVDPPPPAPSTLIKKA